MLTNQIFLCSDSAGERKARADLWHWEFQSRKIETRGNAWEKSLAYQRRWARIRSKYIINKRQYFSYQDDVSFCFSNRRRKDSCLKEAFKTKRTEKKGSSDSSFLPFSISWHFITIIHTLSTRKKENAKHCVNVILWLYLSYRHERPFRRDAQVDFYTKLLTTERRWRFRSKFNLKDKKKEKNMR